MRIAYERRRLTEFTAGLRASRTLLRLQRAPRAELDAWQRERLDQLVRHAVANSRLHRERLRGLVGDGPVELAALPALTKAEMMERFDDLVCDPRLRRDGLLDWIARAERDDHYLGEYRVMTTSGSSGRKGLFVYDRRGWSWIVAMFLRQSDTMGVTPRLPRRRVASVMGAAQSHMSRQVVRTVAVGAHRVLALEVTTPIDELVARLNAFRPDVLAAYPSVMARLAEEQLAGRLRLSLGAATTSSELCTAEAAARIRAAFGVRPHNVFASTEGLWGGTCEHGEMHLCEDTALVENVDADNRPVPAGEPGARLLVTSLVNRVQPIVRLELADVMVLDPDPCPCGRTLVRARAIEGRSDDALALPATGGGEVVVLPLEFGIVSRHPAVAEFQVVQRGAALQLSVVPRDGAGPELERDLRQAVASRLGELGVRDPEVAVRRVAALPRTAGGKLQMVVADRPGRRLASAPVP